RSQSEVHQDSEDSIVLNDMIELEYLLNWTIWDKLVALGLPISKGKFFFPEMQMLSLDKRIEMDMKLAEKIAIDDEYWYNTYGIPKPDGKTKVKVEKGKKTEPPA